MEISTKEELIEDGWELIRYVDMIEMLVADDTIVLTTLGNDLYYKHYKEEDRKGNWLQDLYEREGCPKT
jgi:hypothetical protein